MTSQRRANGEGTVYRRADGRWEGGAAYVLTSAGVRERRRVYGRTRAGAHGKLTKLIRESQEGIPVAATSQTVGEYLRYWIKEVVPYRIRPLTFRTYEMVVREHLIPGLGRKRLSRLTARDVRLFLNSRRQTRSRSPGRSGQELSPRTIFHLHAVLRNALEHAVREDLLPRNVAKQVQISPGPPSEVVSLTLDQARHLLAVARGDRLFALFSVSLSLGLRRGEALGLPWTDVDIEQGVLRVRQTLQRFEGELHIAPPKTRRSRRSIPLPSAMVEVLRDHRMRQNAERVAAGPSWNESGLVFTTRVRSPVEPNDFSLSATRES